MPKHVCGVHLWPFRVRCTATAIKTKRGAWRCPLHGGRSTGPKSPEGKARIPAAARARWAAFREAKADEGPGMAIGHHVGPKVAAIELTLTVRPPTGEIIEGIWKRAN